MRPCKFANKVVVLQDVLLYQLWQLYYAVVVK
jgi:hypothetical protein